MNIEQESNNALHQSMLAELLEATVLFCVTSFWASVKAIASLTQYCLQRENKGVRSNTVRHGV